MVLGVGYSVHVTVAVVLAPGAVTLIPGLGSIRAPPAGVPVRWPQGLVPVGPIPGGSPPATRLLPSIRPAVRRQPNGNLGEVARLRWAPWLLPASVQVEGAVGDVVRFVELGTDPEGCVLVCSGHGGSSSPCRSLRHLQVPVVLHDHHLLVRSSAPEWIRTIDLRFRKPSLFPLSYRG